MSRLKPHNPGARLNLREDDLLITLIMRPSLQVYIVKIIVSVMGKIEFAEWITGDKRRFFHHEEQLTFEQLLALKNALEKLGQAEDEVSFDEIECDYGEYEGNHRILLRFWYRGKETGAFLPIQQFFSEFDISPDTQQRYTEAFKEVLSLVPTQWISSSD